MTQTYTVDDIFALYTELKPCEESLPCYWRETDAGEFVLQFIQKLGFSEWAPVPDNVKALARTVYYAIATDRLKIDLMPTADLMKLALIGDSIHRLHIRLIMIVKKLEGEEKMRFETGFCSNEHQAEYICNLYGLPKPTSKRAIHRFGSQFEKEYACDKSFPLTYLTSVFDKSLAEMCIQTVKECVN